LNWAASEMARAGREGADLAPARERAIRLQVYLAHAGAASRRAAEQMIAGGRVTVNGRVVTAMGATVTAGVDQVALDGRALRLETRMRYLALHKPPLYLCASSDDRGRALARDLLPPSPERLYNVGRLDYRSSGLILFTNDGDFAARVSHPASGVVKEYLVDASGPIPDRVVDEFTRGIVIEDALYRALRVERLGRKTVRVTLVEGKNREIRRVFSYFHLHPTRLLRTRIGPVRLGSLAEGASRPLTEAERRGLTAGGGAGERIKRSETW